VGCDQELTTGPLMTGVGAERSLAMVRGGAGRCGLILGEMAACPGQCVMARASVGPRGWAGVVAWLREGAESGARLRWRQ
jgi:hypothetical protein